MLGANGQRVNAKKNNQALERRVIELFNLFNRRYGSVLIHRVLQKEGLSVGRNRVIRLMKKHKLVAAAKRKFKATTNANHAFPVADNQLNQNFNVAKPNTVYASDITYVRTREGWVYLTVVMDLFSRKIIGWSMDKQMTRQLVIDALLMAYWKRKPKRGVIYHSDRGSQYASHDFQNQLHRFGFKCSMSGKGCFYDNAVIESFFHTLKIELLYNMKLTTREETKCEIFNYIEGFYNRIRMHSTLGYCFPDEFERKFDLRKVA
jgi:putative transposase